MEKLEYIQMELMKLSRNLARHVLSKFRSKSLFKLCRFYVNTFTNDMDCYFYTNGEYKIAKKLLPHCKIVFDVGAGTGEWSKIALAMNQDVMEIHAFEPSNKGYDAILAKRLLIKVNKLALGARNEESLLYCGTFGGSNSIHHSTYIPEEQKKETITVTTLDDYCQKNNIKTIDYLKIDVEGHELSVLKGASRMLSEGNIRYIQFEYGPNYIDADCLLKDVFEFMKATNPHYQFAKIMQNKLLPVPNYHYQYENFLNSNWLISKSSM